VASPLPVWVYVTWQDAVAPLPASVHEPALKLPGPVELTVTVPVGVTEAEAVSDG
jgi:hypothetical protein